MRNLFTSKIAVAVAVVVAVVVVFVVQHLIFPSVSHYLLPRSIFVVPFSINPFSLCFPFVFHSFSIHLHIFRSSFIAKNWITDWHWNFLSGAITKSANFTQLIRYIRQNWWHNITNTVFLFSNKRAQSFLFFVNLRLDYIFEMFLFLKKSNPLRSYKHGPYKKKKRVFLSAI